VYNLGRSDPISLRDMVATIEAATGRRARIERLPDQPGDVRTTFADVTKARERLGYRPRVSFPEGVRRFVAWCRETNGGA
jgi:UDP-glucuronate 4-epimerase